MWKGISLACLGTWGDQIENMKGCIKKEGTRARQARLSEDGTLRASWTPLSVKMYCLLPCGLRVTASHPGCFSVCGTIKGSVGGTGLTFKSDEKLSFHEVFS